MQEPSNSSASQASKGLSKANESMNGAIPSTLDKLSKLNENHLEGKVTKAIENQTSKIPSVVYLGLAVGAMALSAGLAATSQRKGLANFVGLWAPSILMLGIYNKIVKTNGSDSRDTAR